MATTIQRPKLSETELAWAAGFYDGEGSTTYGGKKSMRLAVSQAISENEEFPEVLIRFNNAIGGRVKNYNNKNDNRLKPCYVASINKKEDVWITINLLWPYLSSVKKQQIISVFRKMKEYNYKTKKREFCRNGGHLMSKTRKYWANGARSYCGECEKTKVQLRKLKRRENATNKT